MQNLEFPRRARPPHLSRHQTLAEAAACVLREMFAQFTTNLSLLRTSDDPEVVHQARVGWRRFKSALRLFKPVLNADTRPSWGPLQGMLTLLGELRELDVAGAQTLPSLELAFTAGNTYSAARWQAMAEDLAQATTDKRQAVRVALLKPRLATALLDLTEWLETTAVADMPGAKPVKSELSLRRWARRRIAQLHDRLKLACKAPASTERQHQTRIAAKRLRYGIEALRPLLPKRRTERWFEQAMRLQSTLGAQRDLVQAGKLVSQLQVDRGLVEFLRGVAVGRSGLLWREVRAIPATAP